MKQEVRRKRVVALVYRIAAKRIAHECAGCRDADIHDIAVQALKDTRTFLEDVNRIHENFRRFWGAGESTRKCWIGKKLQPEPSEPELGEEDGDVLEAVLGCGSGVEDEHDAADPDSLQDAVGAIANSGIYAGTFAACTRALRRTAGQPRARMQLTSLSSSPPVRRGIWNPREEVSPFVRRSKLPRQLPPLREPAAAPTKTTPPQTPPQG